MSHLATIRSFQKVLSGFKFQTATSFSEQFAIDRFRKKFQVPDESLTANLQQKCWDDWLADDQSIPKTGMPLGEWYKVRDFLHENLGVPSFREIQLPKGSEFVPTNGKNSLEAKLSSSRWTCTPENFPLFSKLCYSHKGLKRAARKRYLRWYHRHSFDLSLRQADRFLYKRFAADGDVGFKVFSWKLSQIVSFQQGSRFSSVPKNNEKRRPINIECFGNLVVQRTLGNWIRSELARIFSIDLDQLALTHRIRIKDVDSIATIDLKNASDRISLDLCRFLLPRRILKHIETSRSSMVLGYDGDYHLTKKVSSMGNGFTFELMTLILTCLCKQLDAQATVFGDDIIIERSKASRLIALLENVGLIVNLDKSFIDGPFREICGANYHNVEGYIESYDFTWPETIGDCCTVFNKCRRLTIYPSFRRLYYSLLRTLPPALHGGPNAEFESLPTLDLIGRSVWSDDLTVEFPLYFVTPRCGKADRKIPVKVRDRLLGYNLNPDEFYLVRGFEYKPRLRSPTARRLSHRLWAKYEMYLASGRCVKDVLTGEGEWSSVWFVTSGLRSFRAKTLMI